MKAILVPSCALLLFACGGGGGESASQIVNNPPPGNAGNNGPVLATVSGVVLGKSGAPIAGTDVYLFHHNDHTLAHTITNAAGAYAFSGVSTGANTDYMLYVEQAGYGFYPVVSDPAGHVERLDYNGRYRTGIRFAQMPAHDVTGANFTAFLPTDQVASLPRTGQLISFALGDDAAALKGVAWPLLRFTDNLDGTVTDHLTGLVWLKNAGCFAPSDWATALAHANTLASGSCGLTDGSAAGDWRMPNVNELESLIDVSQSNPAISALTPFTNVAVDNAYWSSTTYTALNTNAMAIRFADGRWINGIDPNDGAFDNAKARSLNSVWAVRNGTPGLVKVLATGVYPGIGGGSFGSGDDAALQLGAPLTDPRFIDNGNGTLIDTVTGLTWLKRGDCIHATWPDALTAVNNLASGQCGLTDGSTGGQWRLPNRNEMLSLSDRAPTFPQAAYLDGAYQASGAVTGDVVFDHFVVSDYYWTSTTDAADPAQAWSVYSCDFGVYDNPKPDLHYAFAVR
ncbi:MAG TPA: DUF1566 domain-containing protein [Nevskiaceae bacterium]|nr:DUF1566 domain-containing protein [Nevskiaceae bacterium]